MRSRLQVGFDYETGDYRVAGVDVNGNSNVKEEQSVMIHERLDNIEIIMKVLLLHAEQITGQEFTQDDIEEERG